MNAGPAANANADADADADMEPVTHVLVCQHCPDGPARLAMISRGLAGYDCAVRASGCLSGCRSAGAVAIRARQHMAYLFGPVDGGDLAGLGCFLDLYATADGGEIRDARPLGPLRFKVLARIPAV